jgi:hypothetical protein
LLQAVPLEICSLQGIMRLHLTNNSLAQIPPGKKRDAMFSSLMQFLSSLEITTMGRLIELNVAANRLSALPANFSQLATLKSIDLCRNLFTVFPPCLAQMQTLEMIDLSCNSLQRIAADFQWPNLAHLFLQNNKILSLPPAVSRLTALRDLNVTQNVLDFLPYELSLLGDSIEPEHFERIIVYAEGNPFLGLPPRTAEVVQSWEFWGGDRGMCQLLANQGKVASSFSRVKVLVVGSGNVSAEEMNTPFYLMTSS